MVLSNPSSTLVLFVHTLIASHRFFAPSQPSWSAGSMAPVRTSGVPRRREMNYASTARTSQLA